MSAAAQRAQIARELGERPGVRPGDDRGGRPGRFAGGTPARRVWSGGSYAVRPVSTATPGESSVASWPVAQ